MASLVWESRRGKGKKERKKKGHAGSFNPFYLFLERKEDRKRPVPLQGQLSGKKKENRQRLLIPATCFILRHSDCRGRKKGGDAHASA